MSLLLVFYILTSLCGNGIGLFPVIFWKYFIQLLRYNWYLYKVFELLKDCFIVMLNKSFGENITFIQQFVNVIFNISLERFAFCVLHFLI